MLGVVGAPDRVRLVPTHVATRSAVSHDTGLLTPTVYGPPGPTVMRRTPSLRAGSGQALFRPRSRGAAPESCW